MVHHRKARNVSSFDPRAEFDGQDYYEYLLEAAAFGTLSDAEQADLTSFLASSPDARAELADLMAIVSSLPLTLDERAPSPELRDRIQAGIESSVANGWPAGSNNPAPQAEGGPRRPDEPIAMAGQSRSTPRPVYLWAAAAVAALALIVGLVVGSFVLDDEPDGGDLTLEPIAFESATADGEIAYMVEPNVIHFVMDELPELGADEVYQVWLIEGDVAQSAGTFFPDGEFAVAGNPANFDALAVTIEPGPIGSDGPSTEPFLEAELGQGDEAEDPGV